MSRTAKGIALLIPLLGLHACSEYELNDKSDVTVTGTEEVPVIEVDPLVVNFGSLTPEEGTSEPEVITVRNIGVEDLDIHEVILLDSDTAFNITSIGSTLLRPEAETTLLAVFDPPGEDSYLASIFIASNDPETPEVEVTLLGGGESPDI
ncbi:MAG: hypothetical protein QGG40_14595, partial [Myxococcota bacterium]|nr:hypothetical protein [Myxococcota bacterium]